MSSENKLMTPEEAIRNLIDFTEAKRVVSIGTESEEVYAKQKRAYEIAYQILEKAESGNKLEQFLEWLQHEEDAYPIVHHGILIAFAEKYELELETSSEKEVNVL